MNNKINLKFLVILFVIQIIIPEVIYGLGADKAHPWITQEAGGIWPLIVEERNVQGIPIKWKCRPDAPPEACEEFQQYLGTIDPATGLVKDIKYVGGIPYYWPKNILSGSVMEDYTPPAGSALRHSYSGWRGLLGGGYCVVDYCGMSALEWATKELFPKAVEKYSAGNKDTAYYFLGRIAHLLGDMATPAHVHGDVHSLQWEFKETGTTISLSRKPEAIDQDLFELFMDDFYVQWGAKDVTSVPEFSSIRSLFNDLVQITKQYPSSRRLRCFG
jgi:hypothetical protein